MGDEADWAAEQYDDAYRDKTAAREQFWRDIGRRPPRRHRQPFDDDFERILYDAAAIKRGAVGVNKAQLEREVARHRAKLDAAEQRLEALEGIPDADPFEDGTVLRVFRRNCTFACLRAAGHWYTTGRTLGLNRATWGQFVDWLVDGGATEVQLMVQPQAMRLADLPKPEPNPYEVHFPIKQCNAGHAHEGHLWSPAPDAQSWCPGFHVP